MVSRIKKKVKKITAPVLLIHSTGDETIDYFSSQWIYDHIGSSEKNIIWLERSNHVLFQDYDKDEVVRRIERFLQG
jgi:carboxylesterase